jgi:hypothetical protein
MRLRLLFVALLAAAACKSVAPASAQALPGGGYSYLVVPSGEMFRILAVGPLVGAAGKKLSTMIKYAGEKREIDKITADAELLVAAMGPEMEASGETAATLSADVGYDPRPAFNQSQSFNVVFELHDGRWNRFPLKEEAKDLEVDAAKVTPPADPSFVFDRAMAKAGADAAEKFLTLVDQGKTTASLDQMTSTFRAQAMPMWADLVNKVVKLGPGARVELYRLQSRKGNIDLPPGSAVSIQYELSTLRPRCRRRVPASRAKR